MLTSTLFSHNADKDKSIISTGIDSLSRIGSYKVSTYILGDDLGGFRFFNKLGEFYVTHA